TYAATKAYGAVLAEGLWAELRPRGVDVLACVAGAVATPAYQREMARPAPGTVTADVVAESALRALGRGPRVVPGALMRFSAPAPVRPRRLPGAPPTGTAGGAYRDVAGWAGGGGASEAGLEQLLQPLGALLAVVHIGLRPVVDGESPAGEAEAHRAVVLARVL